MERKHIYWLLLLGILVATLAVVAGRSANGAEPSIAPSEPPVDIVSPGTSLSDLQQSGFSREDVLRLLDELQTRGLLKEGITATDIAVGMTPSEIVGPTEAEVKEPVWLHIAGVPEAATAQFLPEDELTTGAPHLRDGHAHFWTVEPGRYKINALVMDWEARQFRVLSHTIEVTGDTPDPPDPPPDPETDYAKLARQWLEDVPASARNAVVKDPVTGEQYTRQQAVGKTFEAIGNVAKSLGSIKATNSMLGTGMEASFGPVADQWRSFAASADRALAALEAEGVTATEYGAVLSTIGRALR